MTNIFNTPVCNPGRPEDDYKFASGAGCNIGSPMRLSRDR